MQSPFAIFRKHQKILTVVLTGLAMFAFIILGAATPGGQGPSRGLLILTGAVFGGGVLWLIGMLGKGPDEIVEGSDRFARSKNLSLMGTVLGCLLAFAMTQESAPATQVTTKIGDFTELQLSEMIQRRQTANFFLRMAWEKTHDADAQPPRSLGFPIAADAAQAQREVVQAELLRHEAESLGVKVNDAAITKFISDALENKLTGDIFQETCVKLSIGQEELFDIFREELAARLAAQLLAPRSTLTPEQYWKMFRRVNVTQELDVAAVPVEPFVAAVGEPGPGDLQALFEKYKMFYPNQSAAGAPGFRQPFQVRVAWLEADYREFEKQAKQPNEAEIKAYYEDNLDTLYRLPNIIPDDPADSATEDKPADESDAPSTSPTPDKPIEPELTSPENKPADEEKKPAEKPADGDKQPEDKPATDAAPKDEDAKPADEQAGIDLSQTVPVALFDEKDDTVETSDAAEKTEAPAEPAPRYRELDDDLKAEIRDRLLSNATTELMQQATREAYAELESFEMTIAEFEEGVEQEERDRREEAARQKTRDDLLAKMKELAEKHGLKLVVTPLLSFTAFDETEEIAADDADAEPITRSKYALAGAAEPTDDEFTRQPLTAAQNLFGGNVGYFVPYLAEGSVQSSDGLISRNMFVYVAIEGKDEHVAEFQDEGIEEQVLKVWKRFSVREAAQARAEKLAALVRDGDAEKTMAELLADQTVTGGEESEVVVDGKTIDNTLTVSPTPAFSWMRRPTTPSFNPFMQQLELSTIPGVEGAGNEFMKTIFEDHEPGDVVALPNFDSSVFYVVKIRNRQPENAGGEPDPAFGTRFMSEQFFFFSPYMGLIREEGQDLFQKWFESLNKKYEVQWMDEPVAAE